MTPTGLPYQASCGTSVLISITLKISSPVF